MYKAVVLVATLCASLALASDRDTRINNRFALTVARRDAFRQKHGLGAYAEKRLTQDSTTTADPSTTDAPTVTGIFGYAEGFVAGLQFSAS